MQFFGSLVGYLAIVIFLLVSGLFLWVFPGIYNIPESGYASLEPFFNLAPWLYLFLIPAITMKLFSEERRTGTIELLLTRPLSDFQIVFAKFLAAFTLAVFTLVPTLIYFYSVWQLGNPVGSIDTGSTWGAYFGLFFLTAIYVSIGLFASSTTDNQIVAFILAMALSFVFFAGFEFIGEAGVPYFLEKIFTWLSISEHFSSVSRGVIDIGDTLYFLGVTLVFLVLTMISIRKVRISGQKLGRIAMVAGLFLVLTFVFSESLRIRLDLTSDKRYTMTRAAREVAKTIQKPVTVELFLAGELQPGFRKLQQEITGKIRDLDRYSNSPVRVIVKDPYEETSASNRNQYFEELAGKGVLPTDVRQRTEQGTITRLIFPGAIIHMDGKAEAVNFLKHNPGFSAEVNLNHSVESIEFELVSALKRLSATHKPNLAFLQGHDELNPYEVRDLAETASTIFNVSFIVTEELESIERPDILVIADPELPFSEKDKFIIDQAFMSGSRLIWLIDPVQVSLDSLSMGMTTLAFPRDLNINDLLFNYGARVNTDLLQDVVCQQILVNTAPSTNRPEFTPQPWYYSPLLTPSDHHPVSRHLNLLQSEFVSSLDTVAGAGNIIKTIILSTSPYARMVRTPAEVSLSIIDSPPARELFNIPHIPVGVLFEGTFFSAFRNRMLNNLGIQNMKIRNETSFGKMMVFADGSLIANKVRYQQGKEPENLPLGYDRVSQQTFGNKEYFLNVLQYLSDDIGIMELRNRNLQLRLLDKVMLRESRNLWVLINTILPILMVLIFGGVYYSIRRRQWKVNKS